MSTRTCMVRICLLFALAFAFPACSDDEVASTNNRPGTDLDVSLDTSPDVPEDPADAPVDTGDDEDATADVDPDEDAESDTDQDVEDPAPRFEICLLGDNPPTSQDCLTEEQLDFGWLPTETLAEQNFRVTNTGLDSFWISDLSITNGGTTDAHFDTITFRLKPNPSNPSAPIQELQTVPARLNAGESLFVTATLMAGTITGTIDSEAVLVELDLNEDEPTTLIIPLIAEIGECATGTMSCDGLAKTGCETNIHDDADNCGACHNVCNLDNVDSICVEGVCKIDGQCAAGFSDCDKEHANGCETNVTTDDDHCGTCGNACARDNADGFCGGASGCDITCHDNFDDCNQDLFAYASDGCETFLPQSVDHCGACGNKCVLNNATPACSASACIIDSCNDGYDNCDGSDANGCEIHIDADVNNCGACGNKCELPNAIAKCTDGGCEIASCHTGFSDCDGDPTNGCEVNLTNDADHCGTCNNECNLAGGSSICVNSTCRVNTCNDGLANCSTDPGAGCQTNIHEDVNNCGACGQVCNLPNAGATCSLGACKIDTCNIGYDSCDANDLTGCETNLNTNVNHCGECGNQCNLPNAVSKCTDGGCEIASCHAGWSDCDGDPSNGCETDLNDVNSCGACNNVCELDNASASCTNQKCTVLSCDAGYSNCNGDHADGCETNLKADDFNCGTCGNTCNLPNAGSTCIEGSCAVTSCTPGFGDCTAAAGCETNLLSSTSHCGGCNIACSFPNAAPVCLGGTCDIGACLGDFQNCDNQLANGCESNIQSDVNNCGGCGIACNLPNANPICTDGGCQIGSCHAGFSDCDGDPSNGCEVNLNTDVNNCGSCNNACELDDATATCQNGNCRIDSCDQGFASCDNNHANGCEIDIYTDNNNCGACGQTCEIPNSVAQCQAPGTCAFVECLPGYLDLNNNLTDGCEYQCTPTPGEDRPGDITTNGYNWMEHDSNCDGIDGDASRAIFVATDGNDNAAGTRQAPMRTIQAAINRIKNSSSGQDQIYVSEGTYTEQITLEPGISIYGGFSRTEGWKRSSEYVSEIYRTTSDTNQNVVAVKGNNIPVNSSAPTVLQNMKIRSGNATGRFNNGINGASSYGIHCVGCAGLELRSNEITAGTGAPGQAGAAGTRGNNGANGSPGGNGDPDGSNRGAGGARGLSCSAGGNGGMGGERGNNPGVAGSPGSGGASGGSGGAGGGCCNYVGKAGDDGSTGGSTNTRGIGGSGAASLDLISNNYWQGASGSAGGQGSHGHGGGGGGGGGGQGAVWGFGHLHGSGNGGGGGGGGGCGGNGGQGGGAGGSSFGIFLINSTGITLLNNIISTDAGGKGGNGGTGGASGAGGIGGLGGAHKLDEIGKGGNGGNGGTGGPGGYGGGGAGGHSIPVMYRNTSLPSVLTNNTLIPGAAGARGTSSAGGNSNGAAGRAQATHSF